MIRDVRQPGKQVFQVFLRVYPVHLAVVQYRHDDVVCYARLFRAEEQPVLFAQFTVSSLCG